MRDIFRTERFGDIEPNDKLDIETIRIILNNIRWQINNIQDVVVELYDKIENIEKQLNKPKKRYK